MKKLFIALVAIILMASCSTPFLVGKNHQLVFGNNKPSKPKLIKMISITREYNETVTVKFIHKYDTIIKNITQEEYAFAFTPVN